MYKEIELFLLYTAIVQGPINLVAYHRELMMSKFPVKDCQ